MESNQASEKVYYQDTPPTQGYSPEAEIEGTSPAPDQAAAGATLDEQADISSTAPNAVSQGEAASASDSRASNDEERYQFWQRRAQEMEQQMASYQKETAPAAMFMEELRNNPQLQEHLRNFNAQGGQRQQASAVPDDFDILDLNTPGTPTHNWLQSTISDRAANAAQKIVEQRFAAEQERIDNVRQQSYMQQQRNEVIEAYPQLKDPVEYDKFERFLRDPKNLTFTNLAKVYYNQQTVQNAVAETARLKTQQRQQISQVPSPPTSAGGNSAPQDPMDTWLDRIAGSAGLESVMGPAAELL